jgi:hypothetical protein
MTAKMAVYKDKCTENINTLGYLFILFQGVARTILKYLHIHKQTESLVLSRYYKNSHDKSLYD